MKKLKHNVNDSSEDSLEDSILSVNISDEDENYQNNEKRQSCADETHNHIHRS